MKDNEIIRNSMAGEIGQVMNIVDTAIQARGAVLFDKALLGLVLHAMAAELPNRPHQSAAM